MADTTLPDGAPTSSRGALALTRRQKIALIAVVLALLAASIAAVGLRDSSGRTPLQKARDYFGQAADGSLPERTLGTLVEKGRDFLALMKGRSPGERTAAELIKSKKAKAAFVPRQRALARVRKPPPVPKEFLEALVPPALPQVAELVPIAPLGVVPTPPGPPIIFPPGPPIIFPPGHPPTVVIPPPPPPQVPSVPEPSTWVSMLLGFGLLGFVLRSRRRRVAALA